MEEMNIPFDTPQEQLAAVNQAIYAVLMGGQSYRLGSKQLTRADLKMLENMQKKLQSQIANQGDDGLLPDTVVAVFDGR